MKKIKLICILVFLVFLNSCLEKKEKNDAVYAKYFIQAGETNCDIIDNLHDAQLNNYTLNQITPNWKNISSGKVIKKITNRITEQKRKIGKSYYFIYSEGSCVILIVHFKGIDETELFVLRDKKIKQLICQIIDHPNFILNVLNEPTPIMYDSIKINSDDPETMSSSSSSQNKKP